MIGQFQVPNSFKKKTTKKNLNKILIGSTIKPTINSTISK